jgi:hypothetical protein
MRSVVFIETAAHPRASGPWSVPMRKSPVGCCRHGPGYGGLDQRYTLGAEEGLDAARSVVTGPRHSHGCRQRRGRLASLPAALTREVSASGLAAAAAGRICWQSGRRPRFHGLGLRNEETAHTWPHPECEGTGFPHIRCRNSNRTGSPVIVLAPCPQTHRNHVGGTFR